MSDLVIVLLLCGNNADTDGPRRHKQTAASFAKFRIDDEVVKFGSRRRLHIGHKIIAQPKTTCKTRFGILQTP